MFLCWEIDIKLCQIYTKIHIYAILFKSYILNRSYSTNTKPIWKLLYPTGAWESQVFCCYNFFNFDFALWIDIIDNIIKYSSYRPYYVTRTSTNDMQYHCHVIQTEITWTVYCTAIGWSYVDVIWTIHKYTTNLIC